MSDAVLFIGCFIFGGSLLAGGIGLLFDYCRETSQTKGTRGALLKDMLLMIGCFFVIWSFIHPHELGLVKPSNDAGDADGKLAFWVAYYTTLVFLALFLFSVSVTSFVQMFVAIWPRQSHEISEKSLGGGAVKGRDCLEGYLDGLFERLRIKRTSVACVTFVGNIITQLGKPLSSIKRSLILAGAHFIAILLVFFSILAVSFVLSVTLKIPAANIYSIFFGIIIAYGFIFAKFIKDDLPNILKDM